MNEGCGGREGEGGGRVGEGREGEEREGEKREGGRPGKESRPITNWLAG